MAGKPASSTDVLAVCSEPCEHTETKSIQECIHLVNAPAVMTLPHVIPRQDVCTVKATFYGPCPVRQVHVCVLLLQSSQQWQLRPRLQTPHSLALQPSALCRL